LRLRTPCSVCWREVRSPHYPLIGQQRGVAAMADLEYRRGEFSSRIAHLNAVFASQCRFHQQPNDRKPALPLRPVPGSEYPRCQQEIADGMSDDRITHAFPPPERGRKSKTGQNAGNPVLAIHQAKDNRR